MNRTEKFFFICFSIIFMVLSSHSPSLYAQENDALPPEYRLYVQNAQILKQFLQNNPWNQEFYQSNLYQGTSLRLAPVLFSLGENNKNSWQGRLIDFLFEKILHGKAVSFSYFHDSPLVSPMGVSIHRLGENEIKITQFLLKRLGSAKPQKTKILTSSDYTSTFVKVTPIAVKLQKFGVVLKNDCLSISRDPRVAATLSTQCNLEKKEKSDALLSISLQEYFPSLYPFAHKFLGIESNFQIFLDWDAQNHRLTPSKAYLPLRKGHSFGSGKIDPALFNAIPSDVLFFFTAFVPDPETLDPEKLVNFLKSDQKNLRNQKTLPVTFVYLGLGPEKELQKPYAMSALLFPEKSFKRNTLDDLESLFSDDNFYEVYYRKVCGSLIAISPEIPSLDKIEKACSQKIPSFNHIAEVHLNYFKGKTLSLGFHVNFGQAFASALDSGWKMENPRFEDPPSEIRQSINLLKKLPAYSFSGKSSATQIILSGVK